MRALYIILFILTIHIALLFTPTGVDGGGYLTYSQNILKGKLPYIDFIEHKPPGLSYLLGAFLLIKDSIYTIKISLLLFNIATAAVIFTIGSKLGNRDTGLIAGIIYLSGLIVYNGYTILVEPYMTFFMAMAALCFIHYHKTGKSSYLLMCGFLVGISVLFKQPAVLMLVGILLYYALKPTKTNLKNTILLIASFTVPILAVVGYFYMKGALPDMMYNIITLNAGYYKFSGISEFIYFNILFNIMSFPILWVFSISAGIIAAVQYIKYRQAGSILFITVMMVSMSGVTLLGHAGSYLIPALAFASPLAAYMIVDLSVAARHQGSSFKLVSGIAVLVLTIPFIMQTGVAIMYLQSHNLNDELIIADYIKSHTRPDEKIFVMPTEAEYYFLSNREPMGRNYWLLDISKNLTWTENSIIKELEDQKINYIIVRRRSSPEIPKIYAYIESNYSIERTFSKSKITSGEIISESNIQIYRRKL